MKVKNIIFGRFSAFVINRQLRHSGSAHSKAGMVFITAVLFVLFFPYVLAGVCLGADGWRVMPIRSQYELDHGMTGGEGEQHMHGIARCRTQPDVMYLSHDCAQVWRSGDGGATWDKPICKGLRLAAAQSIEVDPINPNLVFVVMDNTYNWLGEDFEGLYRSTDGATNWERVIDTDTNYDEGDHRRYRHNVAYDPTTMGAKGASRWYAAFQENGLFRSEDYGKTWTFTNSFSSHHAIFGIYCHPSDGQTVYVASSEGLYVSHDRGDTFASLGNLPSGWVCSLALHPTDPDIVYAAIRKSAVYKSTNGGQTFSQWKSFDVEHVFLNPGFPDVIYLVGSSANTITTHDGGSNWITDMETEPVPGLGRDVGTWKAKIAGRLSGIAPNPEDADEAVAFSRATMWKTTDGGQTFVDSSTLFTGFAWSWWNDGAAFDLFDKDRFAFFNCDVGMTITHNGADCFDRRNDDAPGWYSQGLIGWFGTHAGDIQPVEGSQIIVASVGRYFSMELMRSTDEGRNWQLVTSDKEHHLFIAFHRQDPNVVYAGNKISHDAGATFTRVDFGAYSSYDPSILGMCISQPNTVYALDKDRRRILRSDDRAVTWRLYDQPGWRFKRLDSLPTFEAHPTNPDLVYTMDADHDLAVFDGTSWQSFGVLDMVGNTSDNFVRSVVIDPRHPEVIYAGLYTPGLPCVFRSTDAGQTWVDITYNLPQNGMTAMAVHPLTGELMKGSALGTWVFPPPYEQEGLIYDKLVSRPVAWSFDMGDLRVIAQNWQRQGCGSCQQMDLTFDGAVGLDDLALFSDSWLATQTMAP